MLQALPFVLSGPPHITAQADEFGEVRAAVVVGDGGDEAELDGEVAEETSIL